MLGSQVLRTPYPSLLHRTDFGSRASRTFSHAPWWLASGREEIGTLQAVEAGQAPEDREGEFRERYQVIALVLGPLRRENPEAGVSVKLLE